jgi:hypothetical protein
VNHTGNGDLVADFTVVDGHALRLMIVYI